MFTLEYYSAIKKKAVLPFVTTWMDLEGIMLSETSQREKDKYHMTHSICAIWNKKTKSQAHIYREEIGSCQRQGSGKWVEKILVDFPRLLCLYTSNF